MIEGQDIAGRPAVLRRPPTWFACSGCGAVPADGAPVPLICPNAVAGDRIDHVLVRHLDPAAGPFEVADDPNPYIAYRRLFHAWHAARAAGWTDGDYVGLVRRLDDAVAAVDGHGFRVTPFFRSAELSAALGLSAAGGAWVKDETGNVS
ncbi:MAG TPA: hypothetical protein VFY18_12540, partial [Candidatus Limnocylindrales bacterium]|nr:hypothetical protein [Candidatus Limnocylindrales bacterium]